MRRPPADREQRLTILVEHPETEKKRIPLETIRDSRRRSALPIKMVWRGVLAD